MLWEEERKNERMRQGDAEGGGGEERKNETGGCWGEEGREEE